MPVVCGPDGEIGIEVTSPKVAMVLAEALASWVMGRTAPHDDDGLREHARELADFYEASLPEGDPRWRQWIERQLAWSPRRLSDY